MTTTNSTSLNGLRHATARNSKGFDAIHSSLIRKYQDHRDQESGLHRYPQYYRVDYCVDSILFLFFSVLPLAAGAAVRLHIPGSKRDFDRIFARSSIQDAASDTQTVVGRGES